MTDVNETVMTGRLTKDVEVKEVGKAFLLSSSIAVNRSYKKGEEWVEEASFFNFKYWLKTQKQVDYYSKQLKKGTPLTMQGEFVQEKWEKDGKKQSAYVLMANKIIPPFNFSASNNEGGSAADTDGFPEDVPF